MANLGLGSKIISLRPSGKALQGPVNDWALPEEIIPWSKAQQGPVNDRALQGIASSETFIARLLLPEEMIALKRLFA